MSGMRKHSGVVKTYTVRHLEHGEFTAKGVRDKLQAVQAAAKAWGLQWSAIARECVFSSQSCEAPSEKAELPSSQSCEAPAEKAELQRR